MKSKREYYQILFPLKGLEILCQEGRGQVNILEMEDFNSIVLHKFKDLITSSISVNQSINHTEYQKQMAKDVLKGVKYLQSGIHFKLQQLSLPRKSGPDNK